MRNIIVFLMALVSFLFYSKPCVSAMNYSSLVHQPMLKASEEMAEKYNLGIVGQGGGMMYGVERLSLSLSFKNIISIKEARSLVVNCAQIYINALNSDKTLRPYLAEFPFPLSRITLRFFLHNPTDTIKPNELVGFRLTCGGNIKEPTIYYRTENEKGVPKELFKETYEEAVKQMKIEESNKNG